MSKDTDLEKLTKRVRMLESETVLMTDIEGLDRRVAEAMWRIADRLGIPMGELYEVRGRR